MNASRDSVCARIGELRRRWFALPKFVSRVALATCIFVAGQSAFAQLEPPARITTGRLRIEVQRLMNTSTPHLIYMDTANDHSGRMFFLEQGATNGTGGIEVRQPNGSLSTFLDLSSEIMRVGPMGVLGMAFHPGFADPSSPGYRKLYTYHTAAIDPSKTPDFTAPGTIYNHNVVTEWQVSAGNPNVVDLSTRREVFRQAFVGDIHQGGHLEFGPDGYMYGVIGTPPQGTPILLYAQDKSILQGKMFRIDPLAPASTPASTDPVSANGKYRVPASNPFVGVAGALPEVYALGTRNIYKFSFDRENGDLFAGDVGNALREELNVVTPGMNMGWPYYEANRAGPVAAPGTISPTPTGPLANYAHTDGRAIVAGYTYRGSVPELQGKHIFGEFSWGTGSYDLSGGRILVTDPYDAEGDLKSPVDMVIEEVIRGRTSCAETLNPSGNCTIDGTLYSLAQDDDGEVYFIARRSNKTLLYKIVGAYTLAEGDYNEDGVVDALDYTKWRNTLGQTVLVFGRDADGNRNGTVDEGDFLVWKQHFGEMQQGGPGAGGLAAIPEPASFVMLAGMACLAGIRRGRRNL